ncbi:hypothetical protein PVAND_009252 [Polypedilum vanderplanki]|uniref:ATPase AAA-type core domain-containing protein n=1 Tax=Polypedilum vanderplanki TaxID=319348 RepID=A0A9J6CDI7_POLVA|nr:hypothetical protein PVAND_009252 [Polypedilum vanderplanki]
MAHVLIERFEYATLKNHLENSFEQQYWAKDTVAKAISSKFKNEISNLILIGPKGCGKKEMIETISKFLHVPLVVIQDAHQLRSQSFDKYISMKLLENSSYDVEKAASGIVMLSNVNHFNVDLQRFLVKLMSEKMSLKLRDLLNERCTAELYDEKFEFQNIMFIATIDCDIEGKISRRYINDIIDTRYCRENVVTSADLVKMNVCQELSEVFNFIAPFHARYHQLLKTPLCQI